MLMGVGEDGEEPYVLPYDIAANEFMNLEVVVDGERREMQMSTSRNLAVWLHEALDRFPADPLRFYLASNLPETADVAFSWREFQSRVNNDLIGNLGNYVNRVLSFAERYFEGELPRPEELPQGAGEALAGMKELEGRYEERMLSIRPREALGELLAMGRLANRFFDAQAPWKTRREDPEEARAALYACAVLLGTIAYHAAPYVPEAAWRLQGFFDGPIARLSDLEKLPEVYRVGGAEPLFGRVEDEKVAAAEWQLSQAVHRAPDVS
jgi:methionyl-tRNA synthetase